MKIVSRNSEARLYEKAKMMEEHPHASWRCLHLRLAEHYQYLRHHDALSAITQQLESSDGFMYFCHDGDILILFQGALRPVLGTLGERIDGLKPEQLLHPTKDSPFLLLDLGTQWQEFYRICQAKYWQIFPEAAAFTPYREPQQAQFS